MEGRVLTIARDIHTNAVIGQTCDVRLHEMSSAELVAAWANCPHGFYETNRGKTVTLLTRHGYAVVPRSSVRLEDVSDD